MGEMVGRWCSVKVLRFALAFYYKLMPIPPCFPPQLCPADLDLCGLAVGQPALRVWIKGRGIHFSVFDIPGSRASPPARQTSLKVTCSMVGSSTVFIVC